MFLSMALSIEKILSSSPQIKKDGNAFVLPEEVDATAYVALGMEVLQIPRLCRVEVAGEVTMQTHKGERFYFLAEQVVGLRFGGPESRQRHGGAGFMKA